MYLLYLFVQGSICERIPNLKTRSLWSHENYTYLQTQKKAYPLQGKNPFPVYLMLELICCTMGRKVGLQGRDPLVKGLTHEIKGILKQGTHLAFEFDWSFQKL